MHRCPAVLAQQHRDGEQGRVELAARPRRQGHASAASQRRASSPLASSASTRATCSRGSSITRTRRAVAMPTCCGICPPRSRCTAAYNVVRCSRRHPSTTTHSFSTASDQFEDAAGKKSELQGLDWEAGALYWNCLRSTNGDEPKALAKVRQKYFDEFAKKDLHFFLGTTQQLHFVAPNPWVIIGVLPIPAEKQLGLF
jgi:hypothetical protein